MEKADLLCWSLPFREERGGSGRAQSKAYTAQAAILPTPHSDNSSHSLSHQLLHVRALPTLKPCDNTAEGVIIIFVFIGDETKP